MNLLTECDRVALKKAMDAVLISVDPAKQITEAEADEIERKKRSEIQARSRKRRRTEVPEKFKARGKAYRERRKAREMRETE